MQTAERAVKVLQISDQMLGGRGSFLPRLQEYAVSERPLFVLDCSRLWDMNKRTLRALLSCLEEAMRYNGDVRLASLCPEAEATLRLSGMMRLFEAYATTEDAIESFRRRPVSMVPLAFENKAIENDVEYAT